MVHSSICPLGCPASRGPPHRVDRDCREPARGARRRPLLPAGETRTALPRREPHERRARAMGFGFLRGHPGRPDHERQGRRAPIHRARAAEHQRGRVSGQRRDRE